jgi:uncharacterized protein YodC (DUF2158 family)
MTEEIQVGDVVQLISGSPSMVVFRISKGRAAVCWSHYATGVIREQRIPIKALLKKAPYAKPERKAYTRGADRFAEMDEGY